MKSISPSVPVWALALPFGLHVTAAGCAGRRAAGEPSGRQVDSMEATVARLQSALPRLMTAGGVPGASVALVDGGQVVWARAFGVADATTGAPVTERTVFEAGSLSKPLVAYATLVLADAGRLDLDAPLVRLLAAADRAVLSAAGGDPALSRISARHVLTQTSGLPNEAPRAGPLRTGFVPGERFSYSGEGFRLLQRALEHATGERLDTLVRRIALDPLGMTASSYVWLPEYDALKASGHDLAGEATGRRRASSPNAAASLETTAADYARFVAALLEPGTTDQGRGLRADLRRSIVMPATPVDPRCVICVGRGPETVVSSPWLAWGLGWGLARVQAPGVGAPAPDAAWHPWHWGDNGDMQAFVAADPARGRAVVVLTNSANGMSIMPDVVHAVFGAPHPAFAWLGYERHDAPERVLARAVLARGAAALREWPQARRASTAVGPDAIGLSEARVAQLGTTLLGKERAADAAGVLALAADAYPRSAAVRVALGDAYRRLGDVPRAIGSYRAALGIDSTDQRVARALRRLERPVRVAPALLDAYAGRYTAPFGGLTVTRAGDQLLVRVAGEPTTELVALSERRFLVGDDGGPEITFETDDRGRVTHAQLHLRGQEIRAPRTP